MLLDKHIKTVEKLDGNELIKGNKKDTPKSTRIPLAITYNQFLQNMSKTIRKNWHILSINESLKKDFQNELVIAFKHTKKILGTHRQHCNRKQHCKEIQQSTLKPGKCSRVFEIAELGVATKSQ